MHALVVLLTAAWAVSIWTSVLLGQPLSILSAALGLVSVTFVAAGVSSARRGILVPAYNGEKVACDTLALTFDDGPDPSTTSRVLALLGDEHKATFFVLGEKVRRHPELLLAMINAGHEIAIHAERHTMKDFLVPWRAKASLLAAAQAIENATGHRATWVRPLYGVVTPAFAAAVRSLRLRVAGWSLRSFDTQKDCTAAGLRQCTTRILSKLRGGQVVLLHDAPQEPGGRLPLGPAVLPAVLEEMQRRGLRSVTLSEQANCR